MQRVLRPLATSTWRKHANVMAPVISMPSLENMPPWCSPRDLQRPLLLPETQKDLQHQHHAILESRSCAACSFNWRKISSRMEAKNLNKRGTLQAWFEKVGVFVGSSIIWGLLLLRCRSIYIQSMQLFLINTSDTKDSMDKSSYTHHVCRATSCCVCYPPARSLTHKNKRFRNDVKGEQCLLSDAKQTTLLFQQFSAFHLVLSACRAKDHGILIEHILSTCQVPLAPCTIHWELIRQPEFLASIFLNTWKRKLCSSPFAVDVLNLSGDHDFWCCLTKKHKVGLFLPPIFGWEALQLNLPMPLLRYPSVIDIDSHCVVNFLSCTHIARTIVYMARLQQHEELAHVHLLIIRSFAEVIP